MRTCLSAFLLFPALLPLAGFGQSRNPPVAAKPDLYQDEALVWEKFDTTVRMHADGTGERIVHIVVRLQSEGAARDLSVLSLSYASAYETGTIDYIRVHKPDGTVVETPIAESIEMPAAVTREAPLYSDLKEKQLPVRSVAAGDVLDYQFHTVRTKAEAPGQFWGAEHFLVEGGVVLSQTVTLEVPADKYVQVWSPNHPATPTKHDGLLTYTWTGSQLKPTPKPKDPNAAASSKPETAPDDEIKDPDEDADGRKLPSVAWTTFHSWAEVGDWYRGLAQGRTTPTPAVQHQADELTRAAKTPEEKVRALYEFVSTKTRYVGIDFGVGRYQPHTAAEVLDHAYGDCKDKDTLLESLLRAKGFETAPVLVGVNIALVPELPSPASFNHVITTALVNGERVWLDSTPEGEPYRELVPLIRDVQALVVPDKEAAALTKTPAQAPFPLFERFEAKGALDKDGLLKAHVDITNRSDSELGYRILEQRAAIAQWDQVMQSVAGSLGFAGTVSHADLKPSDPNGPVHVSYDYSKPEYGDWANLRIVPLFPYLEATTIAKDKAPQHDIDQGSPRTLEATTRIQLPEGYSADVPDPVHVKREYATFDKTYRLDKGELIAERKLVILRKKVAKAAWKDYYAYTKEIGMVEGENWITLFPSSTAPAKSIPLPELKIDPNPTPGDKTVIVQVAPPGTPPKPQDVAKADSSNAEARVATEADLALWMKEAGTLYQQKDWSGEQAKLDQVKKARPDYPYLMSMYAALALKDGRIDEAIEDLKTELKSHPDDHANVPLLLAFAYERQKRDDDAIALLKSYAERKDMRIDGQLASLQIRKGDDTGALATLQAESAAHPEDRRIETQLASCLHRLHREMEAAAAAKAALDGADDAETLNDAAYELSETKLDLPLAETSSRKAVEMLETASAQISLQEVNNKAFQQTNLLIAAWDTLGWILYAEGKAAEAEPYIASAWFHRADLVVGNHLAQIYEALGRPSEALTIDELALASESSANDRQASAELRANVERLNKTKAQSSAGNAVQTLQDLRTFRIDRPKDFKGFGTFRVQIGEGGVKDSELVSGADNVRAMTAELNKLSIPNAVPPGSKARLVRDGVLSCTSFSPQCEFVLMPRSGLSEEGLQ